MPLERALTLPSAVMPPPNIWLEPDTTESDIWDTEDETALPPNAANMSPQELEAFFREQWGLPEHEPGQAEILPPDKLTPTDKDEDDYTLEEWDMVVAMRTMCRAAINKSVSDRTRRKAIKWLFVNGTQDPRHGWSFHLLCAALRARPWVIQTLIQHQWFRKGMVIEPLPFLADVLPEALESEAIMCAWESGAIVMSRVWNQPGGLLAELRQQLQTLVQEGLLGLIADRVWVSSRGANFIRPGQRVSWSRSFPGD